MQVLTNSVGRKFLMAVTGLFMVLFVVVHLMGNLSIFAGPDGINAYAAKLHGLGPFVWGFRAFMGAMLALHVIIGILLTLENRAANPSKYAVSRKLKATLASENMIWTGVVLLAFVVYHLLHFTVRALPDMVLVEDAKGRFDVFTMVVDAFRATPTSLLYVAAMLFLFLHLTHGIQSIFQSLGFNNERSLPKFGAAGRALSVLFLLGYSAIPLLILVRLGIFSR